MKIAYVMILVLVLGLVAGCGEKAEPKQIEPVIKGGDVVEDTTTVLDEEPVTETVEEDTEEVMEDEEEVVEEDEEETVEEETTVPEKLPEEKIDIKDMEFIPSELTVKVGTKVRWTNYDMVQHMIDGEGFTSKVLERGGVFVYTFEEEGEFDYKCLIHPNMTGTIVVE